MFLVYEQLKNNQNSIQMSSRIIIINISILYKSLYDYFYDLQQNMLWIMLKILNDTFFHNLSWFLVSLPI